MSIVNSILNLVDLNTTRYTKKAQEDAHGHQGGD